MLNSCVKKILLQGQNGRAFHYLKFLLSSKYRNRKLSLAVVNKFFKYTKHLVLRLRNDVIFLYKIENVFSIPGDQYVTSLQKSSTKSDMKVRIWKLIIKADTRTGLLSGIYSLITGLESLVSPRYL